MKSVMLVLLIHADSADFMNIGKIGVCLSRTHSLLAQTPTQLTPVLTLFSASAPSMVGMSIAVPGLGRSGADGLPSAGGGFAESSLQEESEHCRENIFQTITNC